MPISRRSLSSGARSRHHSTVRLRAAVSLVVVTGLLAGFVAAHAPTARPTGNDHRVEAGSVVPDSTAAAALTAARGLADGAPGTALIGAEVTDALGYSPVPELGLAANGFGDCSSPVPLPDEFEPACRVHDLGYDLLRVAHRYDAEIPRGLRSDLDSLLARQMRDACDERLPCVAMAEIAHVAVHVNTVRQGHGAPVEERFPW